MKKLETSARTHCANYDCGKCLGVMIQTKKYASGGIGLRQILNKKKVGKQCTVASGCQYYDNCVIPGIEKGH